MIDTSVYKNRLEEELRGITEELKELGIHNPQVKEDWIATPEDVDEEEADPNLVADRTEDWDERNAELSTLETRYNNIELALKKISDGTYGICEIDGHEIEKERLDANPAARTCKAHINDEKELT